MSLPISCSPSHPSHSLCFVLLVWVCLLCCQECLYTCSDFIFCRVLFVHISPAIHLFTRLRVFIFLTINVADVNSSLQMAHDVEFSRALCKQVSQPLIPQQEIIQALFRTSLHKGHWYSTGITSFVPGLGLASELCLASERSAARGGETVLSSKYASMCCLCITYVPSSNLIAPKTLGLHTETRWHFGIPLALFSFLGGRGCSSFSMLGELNARASIIACLCSLLMTGGGVLALFFRGTLFPTMDEPWLILSWSSYTANMKTMILEVHQYFSA